MTLGQKQRKFKLMLAHLIRWAYAHGCELTFGEPIEPPAGRAERKERKRYFEQPAHATACSDLNLLIDGVYQTRSEAYRELGEQRVGMSGSWAGRFGRPDGNHFRSMSSAPSRAFETSALRARFRPAH